MKQVNTFCRVCEPSCALVAGVNNGRIESLKPDRSHPVTKGFACHKGLAMLEIHHDPDRLDYPLHRGTAGDQRISWDEAATGISQQLTAIRSKYGDTAIASYTGNPLAFNSLAGPAISSFLVKNGIRRNFSSGTQDCTNKFAAGEAIFGSSTIHPIPDIDETDFLLIFGANPRVSHMSFISIADPMKALRDAAKRGTRIRFVDPRRNESVNGIGEVVQVNPDTDVYLMAAMLNHLHATGQFSEARLAETADHLDGLINFVAPYSPETVAAKVGIDASAIRQLANEFATAPRAAVYMSTGVNMGRQGTLAYWLMFSLSLVTDNFDRPGGNVYAEGFYPASRAGRLRHDVHYEATPFGEVRRIRGSLPGNLMADMILADESPVRALVCISGNPALSIGGGERMRRALVSLELLVVIDIYDNATAHYADYVLPATDMFERPDINLCGLGMQKQPFVQYTNYVVPPKAERRPEWWILARIEQAQGFDSILDQGEVDYAAAFEAYGLWGRFDHMLQHSGTSLAEIAELPSSTLVLEPPKAGSFFETHIQTDSGRIDCCPAAFTEAIERCHQIFAEDETPGQLKMISRRTNYMLNSWFHNVQSLKREQHLDNPVYMHPADARARNLGDGSTARIANNHGAVVTRVVLDDTLKPGTIAMTHGWGQGQTGMRVAASHPGVNANDLLPSGPGSFEKISNQAFMTGIPVYVEAS
ncbi:MAG: molybdopterin-dependent oxidoreductase [Pseudomonadota bacterium]